MEYKLVDLYKTKYFYMSFTSDLIYLFDTVLKLKEDPEASYHAGSDLHDKLFSDVKSGKDVIFDLAKARLTPDAIRAIQLYMTKGVRFTDTEDGVRAGILIESEKRLANSEIEFTLLPKFTNRTNIKEYLSSLSRDVQYTIPEHHADLYIPIVVLAQLYRPTVQIAFGSKDKEIFEYVGSQFTTKELQEYGEFYFSSPNGSYIIGKNANGKYDIQQKKNITLEEVLSNGYVVPTVFGTKRLVKEEPWATIVKKCFNVVDSYKSTYQPTIAEALGVS